MCTVYEHVISQCTVRILLRQGRIVGKLPGQGQPCADDWAEELDEGRMAGSSGMIFPFFCGFWYKRPKRKDGQSRGWFIMFIYIYVYSFELPHERHIFSILAWTTPAEGNDVHSLVNHESRDSLIGRQFIGVMDSIPRKGCILPSTRQRVRNPSLLFRKHGWEAGTPATCWDGRLFSQGLC